jgi:hypothetical protein
MTNNEQTPIKQFNPSEHLIQLKSKAGSQDYLPVKWRIAWFRWVHPHGTIDTEEVLVDLDRVVEVEAFVWNAEKRRSEKIIKQSKGYARFRCVVTDGKGGRATGTKAENAANFPDYVEKSETGSIGRALAAMGFGTQFTDDEFAEGERIVDSPVERSERNVANNGTNNERRPAASNNADNNEADANATEQQISSIRKLCTHLNKKEPANVTSISYLAAKKLIQQLTAEYRESRQNGKAS